MKRVVSLSLVVSSIVLVAACGGGAGTIPAVEPSRPSGQSSLMGTTFAGSNKCDAKNHVRPFVIEWDATDMSEFESKAANNVVVVKYHGCDLQVLDGCTAEVNGALGAYGAVEWTSGSLEKVDIANEGELYAKLPLGAGELGGRVSAGEKFHMEYYVSGTRKSTRDAVYKADLDKIPSCKGATHFVYSYNLGAFALGSAKQIKGEVGATVWGIGAGGSKSSLNSAEKKGGVITSCSGESAREVQSCKVPIRLTLREIHEGQDVDATAATAPESAPSMNLAGKVDSKIKMDDAAKAHIDAAIERQRAGDGKACLKELDAADRVNRTASQLSTNPAFYYSQVRAQCVMLSGKCDAGKAQFRKALQAQQGTQLGPEVIDTFVDHMAGKFCQGASMSPRDQLLAAASILQESVSMKKHTTAECTKAWDSVRKLAPSVKPRDEDDHAAKQATDARQQATNAAYCYARGGDCGSGFKAYAESQRILYQKAPVSADTLRAGFEGMFPTCKGK